MSWDGIERQIANLEDALKRYAWDEVETLCADIRARLYAETDPLPQRFADSILSALQRKRRFALMQRMAETMLLKGVTGAKIRRRCAQAMIEQGAFLPAQYVLESILQDASGTSEHVEARGLLGRLFKQLYVNPAAFAGAGHLPFLQRSVSEYDRGYKDSGETSYWNGINLVALLRLAADRGSPLSGYPDPQQLAETLWTRLRASNEYAFEIATRMEALVALNRFDDAFLTAAQYVVHNGADAFEIGSTERQLVEVWGLSKRPEAERLLTLLRSELLRKQGGALKLSPIEAHNDSAAATQLEAILGSDRTQTLIWYKNGLTCCDSVARIETRGGKGFGTGWLVRGEDLSEKWRGQKLLITNKHVISPPVEGRPFKPTPETKSLLPGEAQINMQTTQTRLSVDEVLWSSQGLDIDATIVRVKDLPADLKTLDVQADAPSLAQPPQRVYIIGHPGGRDLEFSLNDNLMLACDGRRVHYRAPTEGGSSGSPVFEPEGWQVIALHHAGGQNIAKLDGTGNYPANEGIAIRAIREAIEKQPPA